MAAKRGRPPKKSISQKVEDALGVAEKEVNDLMPASVQKELVPIAKTEISEIKNEISPPKISQDAQEDYDFVRTNLHSLLNKGNEVLNGMVDLVQGSDSPRSYEVAGNLIKVLIEGSRELMTLHKDIREVEKKSIKAVDDNPINIAHAESVTQNIVTEASTLEMLEYFEEKRKNKSKEEGVTENA